ncbi:hypothetical protein BJX63DRAFT_267203 [Aspergillus granulosus]|uniref:BZIP domain-containing protein n=1 Tax=Aspergillus granulosus TaxID=176169 RepID=A0ABR4HAH3_9EURO
MNGFQDFDLFSAAYSDNSNFQSIMPIEANLSKMQPAGIPQMLNSSPTLPSTRSSPVSPTGSDSESQAGSEGLQSYPVDPAMQNHAVQSVRLPCHCLAFTHKLNANYNFEQVKRRMQNRQAQRRFRERKEERQQSLEQKAVNLEKKHRELSEEFRLKCEEASQLLREREGLKGEIEDLRKRWRLMVGLLQRPNGAQSLATLLAGDSLSQSSSSAATESTGAPAPLDELLGCLHALVVPNKSMPHTN